MYNKWLKKIKETKKNLDLVKKIQNFCENILNDPNKKLARKTLNIIISLYQKKYSMMIEQ